MCKVMSFVQSTVHKYDHTHIHKYTHTYTHTNDKLIELISKQKLHEKTSLFREHSDKYKDKEVWLCSWSSKAGMRMHRDILKEQKTEIKRQNGTEHVDVDNKLILDNISLLLRLFMLIKYNNNYFCLDRNILK